MSHPSDPPGRAGGDGGPPPSPAPAGDAGDAAPRPPHTLSGPPQAPALAPCVTCPYRRDVPSGLWAREEYTKLPLYDAPTPYQPHRVFMCHQDNGRICGGWAGCHDTYELLALRFAAHEMSDDDLRATLDYTSPVPLFSSGAEAAEHGMADVDTPGPAARRAINRLHAKRDAREKRTTR